MSARVLMPARRLGKSEVARAIREAMAAGGAIEVAMLARIAGKPSIVVIDELSDDGIEFRAVDPDLSPVMEAGERRLAIFELEPAEPQERPDHREAPRHPRNQGNPKRWRK